MKIWNPNPSKTSAIIISGGANVIVPSDSKINNYSEIIIDNGSLTFESAESYNGGEKSFIRIGNLGKMTIPEFNKDILGDCASGAVIVSDGNTFRYDGDNWVSEMK